MVVTVTFWVLEVWCAYIIAKENEPLWLPKVPSDCEATGADLEVDERYHSLNSGLTIWPQKLYCVLYQDPRLRLKNYFSMPVWPASISISILQLSVLAYSATLVTYLLEVGYSLSAVTIARASGSLMALLGTFVLPIAANYLRRRYARIQRTSAVEIEGRVVRRVGLWGVSSQLFFMVCHIFMLLIISHV
jgi:iron-regulated transporter 1